MHYSNLPIAIREMHITNVAVVSVPSDEDVIRVCNVMTPECIIFELKSIFDDATEDHGMVSLMMKLISNQPHVLQRALELKCAIPDDCFTNQDVQWVIDNNKMGYLVDVFFHLAFTLQWTPIVINSNNTSLQLRKDLMSLMVDVKTHKPQLNSIKVMWVATEQQLHDVNVGVVDSSKIINNRIVL